MKAIPFGDDEKWKYLEALLTAKYDDYDRQFAVNSAKKYLVHAMADKVIGDASVLQE